MVRFNLTNIKKQSLGTASASKLKQVCSFGELKMIAGTEIGLGKIKETISEFQLKKVSSL